MRKLASIQTIVDIQPIEGKDRIELATVLGWHVIVKKDEFKVGDKCIYVEIDSVMPEYPEFEFLRSKKFRIKTMKLGPVYSQGICFPMSLLESHEQNEQWTGWNVGDDVTSLLGIKQYEPDMDNDKDVSVKNKKDNNPLMRFKWYRKLFVKKKHNGFPEFLEKTDEIRIQNAPWMLEDKEDYILTEKVDGSSGTFALVHHKFLFWNTYEYIVCSRNLRLTDRDNSIYWAVSDKYKIEQALRNMIGNREWIAIQGECVGPKIQKNKYNFTEPHFYAFNLIDPTGRKNSVQAMNILATKGIDFVPIINEHFKLPDTVDEMLKVSTGKSQLGETLREGLVVRSMNGKKSFKAVSPEFLLHYNL